MVWALTVKGQGMDQHLFKNKAEWKESQLSPKTLKLDENPQKCSEQKEHSGEKNGWMEGWITEWLDIWNEDKLFNRETEANQWDRSRYRNTQCMLSLQLYLTLYNPMGCSPPGSSVHGILQARTLEWVAVLERNKINTRERVRKRDPSGVSNRVSWPSAHNNLAWSVSEQRNSSVCVREHTCTGEQCFPNFSVPTNHSGLWWSGQWLMRFCIASSL